MNKQSIIIFSSILLISFVIFLILLPFAYQKPVHNITFYATVKEANDGQVILTPFPDGPLAQYPYISAHMIGIDMGMVVKVTCKPEIMESYPVQITVVNYEMVARPSPIRTTTYGPLPWEIAE